MILKKIISSRRITQFLEKTIENIRNRKDIRSIITEAKLINMSIYR